MCEALVKDAGVGQKGGNSSDVGCQYKSLGISNFISGQGLSEIFSALETSSILYTILL